MQEIATSAFAVLALQPTLWNSNYFPGSCFPVKNSMLYPESHLDALTH